MFKIICVTNRKQCNNFLERAAELYNNGVDVILREKDLTENEYEELARHVLEVCPNVILHTYTEAAKRLGVKRIHLPLHLLSNNIKKDFEIVGASIHSAEEAVKAQKMGADYVTAGHVFATDCKKGLAPRGIPFLKAVVSAVDIPVYGIGGISPENMEQIKSTGAAGACMMSAFMRCTSVKDLLN